jgi:hypothetical protein
VLHIGDLYASYLLIYWSPLYTLPTYAYFFLISIHRVAVLEEPEILPANPEVLVEAEHNRGKQLPFPFLSFLPLAQRSRQRSPPSLHHTLFSKKASKLNNAVRRCPFPPCRERTRPANSCESPPFFSSFFRANGTDDAFSHFLSLSTSSATQT